MRLRALILLFTAIVLGAAAKPKLVVNIVVGQMRYDYLLRYGANFSDKGFKRLINDGVLCDRAMYSYLGTSTPASLATLNSGANPSTHGIIGYRWYNNTTAERVDLLADDQVQTVGGEQPEVRISPVGLIVSGLADCLKLVSPQSKVVSVALEPVSAVVMGSFSADGAYWLAQRDGKFSTTTFYNAAVPQWVKAFNDRRLAELYAAEPWVAMRGAGGYKNIFRKDILYTGENQQFNLKFDYNRFASTPGAVKLLREFATDAIIFENLGKDEHTDLINIVLDPMRLIGEKYGTNSIELEDAYYQLDFSVELLLGMLDNLIGAQNYVVVLSSDHGAADPVIESSRLPGGRFDGAQFKALMNGYLGGFFGEIGEWVLDYSGGQLFLNRPAIFAKGVALAQVQQRIADFAIQFRGVAQAITANSLQTANFTYGIMHKAQNSYYQRHSGDVMINYLPGWSEKGDKLSDSGTSYNYDTHVPLIFYGAGISNQNIARDVDMTELAATIAHIMEVAPPNAATGKPIIEIYAR